MGGAEVDFRNGVFFTARILPISYGGRELFLSLLPEGSARDGAAIDLQVGDHCLRIGVRNLSACIPLSAQLEQLALEIYPPDVQAILLESLFDPLLTAIEGWLAEPATIEAVHLKSVPSKKTLPCRLSFSLYEKNPHEGKAVPLLLSGSLAVDWSLAKKILETIRAVEPVPSWHCDSTLPSVLNCIASFSVMREELADLRVGDVILLENSNRTETGLRELVGLRPYRIHCRQEGNKMTVISYVQDHGQERS
ncbi:MAG: hypothetical protein LBH53_01910 [Puniceicoccales bacterium]|jgi:hypothetical protein|nr:hypothetical protein [Puniceicoccales bacterium]